MNDSNGYFRTKRAIPLFIVSCEPGSHYPSVEAVKANYMYQSLIILLLHGALLPKGAMRFKSVGIAFARSAIVRPSKEHQYLSKSSGASALAQKSADFYIVGL